MKKIISFIVAFNLFGLIWGQDTINNFYTEENEIIWQKVYETTLSFEQLNAKISESGLFEKMNVVENRVTGDLKSMVIDYKGAGYSRGFTPMYLLGNFFTAFAIVDFKEGKYRITLKKIMLEKQYDDPLSKRGERNYLNIYAIKSGKNEFKEAFKGDSSIIIDYTFTKMFDFKIIKENQNW